MRSCSFGSGPDDGVEPRARSLRIGPPAALALAPCVVLLAIAGATFSAPATGKPEGGPGVPSASAAASAAQGEAQNVRLVESDLHGLRPRNIGPAIMSGRFVDIEVVESDTYTWYVASATGGVWRTVNNGVTFEPVFENEATHSVGDIALFQPDPDILWVGTGERANRQSNSWGDGVYKSTDGGATWTNVGLEDSKHIGRIVTHPSDPDVIWVAAMGHLWGPNEERGLYKTSDGGATWERLLYIDEVTGVSDVAVDPTDPDVIFAAAYQRMRKAYGFHGGGPGSGLYRSRDGGRTWENLSHRNGLPEGDYGRIGIGMYRRDPDILYVSIEQGERYTASTSYEQRGAGLYRSDDGGDAWELRSDWNPRPMYASQVVVDPTDPDRIYMHNQFSVSEDGGRTFRPVRQSVHGDDRFTWVNPNDSRHLVKASDGAIGITYDRGDTWLFVESLPVSQFYRVDVDMSDPYRVCGGLQDNGSWCGPGATYRAEGILNEDWFRVGGGDGFFNVFDPSNPSVLYVESQYLGLTRKNLVTHETRTIRPGEDQGYLPGRRNWEVWGQDVATPVLGNNMKPANWDAPVALSPHDSSVVYAGTNELWRSTDGGGSWESLGDLTTRVDRAELPIMGEYPHREVRSLDDGVPYYPTLTAIAESPLRRGLIWVGADDGSFHVSNDDGATFTRVSDRFPGLPENAWVAGIEPSRFNAEIVYAVFDNHRLDDYTNYLYVSGDAGMSWRSIVGDLPPERVLRTVREDPRNPRVLYVGAERGLFVTIDGGEHWVELKNNMPTLAFNDLAIHPRDNDLVLGSHGRGVWILDKINAIQELGPAVMASPGHLFTMETARQVRRARLGGNPGHNVFYGDNPPDGAIIDYWVRDSGSEISVTIHDPSGAEVAAVEATNRRGVNRVVWDLRHATFAPPAERAGGRGGGGQGGGRGGGRGGGPRQAGGRGGAGQGGGGGLQGPYVVPGTYTVRLTVGSNAYEQPLVVEEDPRLAIGPAERRAWTTTLLVIGGLYEAADELVGRAVPFDEGLGDEATASTREESAELRRLTTELHRRIESLYNDVESWTGGPTAEQYAQMRFFSGLLEDLGPRVTRLVGPGT